MKEEIILKDIEVWDVEKVCPGPGISKYLDVEDRPEPESLGGCFIIFWFVIIEALVIAFSYSYN